MQKLHCLVVGRCSIFNLSVIYELWLEEILNFITVNVRNLPIVHNHSYCSMSETHRMKLLHFTCYRQSESFTMAYCFC